MPRSEPRRPARHTGIAVIRRQRRRPPSGARRRRSRDRRGPPSLRRHLIGRSVMEAREEAPTPTLPRRPGREGPAPQAREGGGYPAAAVAIPAAALAQARRLVVKIGSALLVHEDGEIPPAWP